jgi:cbb3-type cytochrome c oxidase subunit III
MSEKHRLLKFFPILGSLIFILCVVGCSEQAPTGDRSMKTASTDGTEGSQEKTELQQGKALFDRMCATCHGPRGNGGGTRRGPSLQRDEFTYGRDFDSIKKSIHDGRPDGMPFFHHALSAEELEAVTNYVLSLGG